MKRFTFLITAVLLLGGVSVSMAKGSSPLNVGQGIGSIGVNSVDTGPTCSRDRRYVTKTEDIYERVYSRRYRATCYGIAAGGEVIILASVPGLYEAGKYLQVVKQAAKASAIAFLADYVCGNIATHPNGIADYDRKIGYREWEVHEWSEWNSFYNRCETRMEGKWVYHY